jgi:hypothetical protein
VGYTVAAIGWAGLVGCSWLLLTRLFPTLGEPEWIAGGSLVVAVVTALGFAIVRRPTLTHAALEADQRLGLRERLTSSLSLADSEGPMVQALHEDARKHLNRLKLGRDFPLTTPRALRWAYIPLIVFGIGYIFLPEFDLFNFEERAIQAKEKQEAAVARAERLRQAVKPLAEALDREDMGEVTGLTGEVDRIAEDLQSGALTEKQALAKVSSLAEQMRKSQDGQHPEAQLPEFKTPNSDFGTASDIAKSIQSGDFSEAAKKARELKKQMENKNLSEEKKKKIAEDLEKLAKEMGGDKTELGKSLSKLAGSPNLGSQGDSKSGELSMSMEDLASLLEQMENMKALENAVANLENWKSDVLGPSNFCRTCGAPTKPCELGGQCKGGQCKSGQCSGVCSSCKAGIGGAWQAGTGKMGGGMGKAGIGRGGQIGELPDVNANFKPTVAPGEMTEGSMLASIVQRGAPEEGAESTISFSPEAIVQVQQQAEQALTQEEIPPGSKEFVRQYFGTLAPQNESASATVDNP